MSTVGKRASATDVSVAQRIRACRKAAGISQTELGDQIGVTIQQVQKYENGTNRVGAGRLAQIASALHVPITAFFGGPIVKRIKQRPAGSSLDELIAQPRAYTLLEAFCRMPYSLQVAILQFVRSLRMAKRRRKNLI